MITEERIVVLRKEWGKYPGYKTGSFEDALDTIESLWKVARAMQTMIKRVELNDGPVENCVDEGCKVCDTNRIVYDALRLLQ